MKPDKVLCCMFLLAISGFDPAQNLEKWLCVLLYPINRSLVNFFNSCIDKEVNQNSCRGENFPN